MVMVFQMTHESTENVLILCSSWECDIGACETCLEEHGFKVTELIVYHPQNVVR